MQSLKYLYRIGNGPSSSHTMGPIAAARRFIKETPIADEYKVILYGSLAKTGRGHMTPYALEKVFESRKSTITFDYDTPTEHHPNTMDFIAYKDGNEISRARFYSVGGGEIVAEGETASAHKKVYSLSTFNDISAYCKEKDIRLWQYVEECEGKSIWEYLDKVWTTMKNAVLRGIQAEGILHGGIGLERKSHQLYTEVRPNEAEEARCNRLVCAYAYAVSEENAAGGLIVTAPTCGSCGVLPAVLKYLQDKHGFTDTEILHALATGSIIGNLIKTNASISGAECGCQAEIGTACAMAAAAAAELFGLSLFKIEYAAEMSIEHHLGLTCDPIGGLVQIPCIERNAVAAMRALNAVNLVDFLGDSRKISFDMVVETMYETGKDLKVIYRETAEGGLAKKYQK